MGIISLADGSVKLATDRSAEEQSRELTGDGTKPQPAPVADALKLLVEYIPTEVLALYVVGIPTVSLVSGETTVTTVTAVSAVAGATAALDPIFGHPNAWDLGFYLVLIVLCPLFFLLWFFANAPRKDKQRFPEFTRLEWWRLVAAPISFAVWAMAIPGNPFLHTPGWLLLASLLAVLVSGVMGHVDKIIRRSMTPADKDGG